MRVAVYTSITGGYDAVKAPRVVDPGVDFFCFTDSPKAVPRPWRAVHLDCPALDTKDSNRYPKINPHLMPELSGYDLTVYVDGSIEIVGSLEELISCCADARADIHLYDHPFRDCAYDEAVACAHFGLAPLAVLATQMRRYRAAGYPAHAGLTECGVIVRRRSPALDQVMDAWWDEYLHGARRDQLSLGYVAWRAKLEIGSLGTSDPREGHRAFRLHKHADAPRRWRAVVLTRWNRLLLALLPRSLMFGRDAT